MKWTRGIVLMCLMLLFSLGASTATFSQSTYEVTIYNLTQNQVITPRSCEPQWSYVPLYGGPTCDP